MRRATMSVDVKRLRTLFRIADTGEWAASEPDPDSAMDELMGAMGGVLDRLETAERCVDYLREACETAHDLPMDRAHELIDAYDRVKESR